MATASTTRNFRTESELQVGPAIADIFDRCTDSTEHKIENFPKYARRQHLKRFLAHYEIFQKVLHVKGSIIECGVFRGFGFMSWAKLSTILEPENLTRRIYGFDSFSGFPSIAPKDQNAHGEQVIAMPQTGDLEANSKDELEDLIEQYDKDRFLGHIDKAHLIAGDACESIPKFVQEHPHLVVSLLFLDFDLYEPTKVAIEQFLPRMPKGSIIAFDELDNPIWPGETQAILDTIGMNNIEIQRLPWDPFIGFAVL
ncbi:TylF/MycF/NovP-related O-methyltransferase [Roseimaritima ulvae]|uniref:Macrocin-O-methyltransferase (TylF) n=1 Tax=Roseimaritima ulvae TaxID=980254 RepID=A0A5B9QZV4_9BACT|nr:TylF/MycF/NovP-related O-methyltransferase [Roseimaritima ulvae]QEG42975.1 Macrocin-O-methyltransferase (TylF) [Roseimaritima ulvae]